MEIFVGIALLFLALAFCFEKLTNFIKQLNSSKPKGLLSPGKVLKFNLSFSSENKKEEVCATNTNSSKDSLD